MNIFVAESWTIIKDAPPPHKLLFERSEFLIATCKKKKTDRVCVWMSVCSVYLGFSVYVRMFLGFSAENCLGFSVGYQPAPGTSEKK